MSLISFVLFFFFFILLWEQWALIFLPFFFFCVSCLWPPSPLKLSFMFLLLFPLLFLSLPTKREGYGLLLFFFVPLPRFLSCFFFASLCRPYAVAFLVAADHARLWYGSQSWKAAIQLCWTLFGYPPQRDVLVCSSIWLMIQSIHLSARRVIQEQIVTTFDEGKAGEKRVWTCSTVLIPIFIPSILLSSLPLNPPLYLFFFFADSCLFLSSSSCFFFSYVIKRSFLFFFLFFDVLFSFFSNLPEFCSSFLFLSKISHRFNCPVWFVFYFILFFFFFLFFLFSLLLFVHRKVFFCLFS